MTPGQKRATAIIAGVLVVGAIEASSDHHDTKPGPSYHPKICDTQPTACQ